MALGRKTGGKRKGYKATQTLEKEQAREYVRATVTQALQPLLQAQISAAQGLSYLVTRDRKTGKFLRVTEAMARVKLGKDEELVEVWEKDPSTPAFTELLNRALDKPKEQPQEIIVSTSEEQLRLLHAGRARAAALRASVATVPALPAPEAEP